MPIKNETKTEFRRIINGIMYHCMDLTKFMNMHMNDPYFETEQGKRMFNYAMEICGDEAMIIGELLIDRIKNDSEYESKQKDIEDIEDTLKGML